MADPLRTLDVREPQILRHYPNDANHFYWHHRLLIAKISPGVWIGLTPDHDLERIDLHQVEHIPLERRAEFPHAQSPYVYAFDDLPRVDLERLKRRAAGMAALFNDAGMDEDDNYEWMIADVTHKSFGERVEEDVATSGVTMGDSALAVIGDQEVYLKRVLTSQKASIIENMDAMRSDARLLGDHRDNQSRRFLGFKEGLAIMKEDKMPDWPLQGPRVMLEFLQAVRSGPGDLATYHLSWSRASGVNPYSMVSHEHRILCNILRAAIEVDQFNLPNALSFEIIARRIVQVETAVARNALNPDFTGLELVLEDPVGPGGEASTSTG